MDSRERFKRVSQGLNVDRVPLFEEETRPEVLSAWHRQGLSRDVTEENFRAFFSIDRLEYIYLWFEPRPGALRAGSDFQRIEDGYRNDIPDFRRPDYWEKKAREYGKRNFPLGITGWRGFMLPLFSREREWDSLQDVLLSLYDFPQLVKRTLSLVAECHMETIHLALRYLDFDFGVVLEPIASPAGPVISPQMFREFVLPHYRTIVDFFHGNGIDTVIFRSMCDVGSLLTPIVESKVDGLWIGQVHGVIDYLKLRRENPNLLLLGGIDATTMLRDPAAISNEVGRQVPVLVQGGRYLPGLDDRPRENIPYGNYRHYRRALQDCLA
jgi:hypothetical protein